MTDNERRVRDPDEDAEILMLHCWVWRDRQGHEHPLYALVPSPAGGERVLLWYDSDDANAEGYDVIARQYAKSGRVLAFKRRYLLHDETEVIDGSRLPTPEPPAADPRGTTAEADS